MLRRFGRFKPPDPAPVLVAIDVFCMGARTCIDVGANVGIYSAYFRRQAPRAWIYAFEPNPEAMQLLRHATRNLDRVVCLEVALGDEERVAAFVVPRDAFGNHITGLGHVARNHAGADFEVPMRTLDSVVAQGIVTVAAPVLLKIDVEGSEYGVLRGAAGILKRFNPIVYFECEARHHASAREASQVFDFLRNECEYTVLGWSGETFRTYDGVADGVPNYIALPSRHIELEAVSYETASVVAAMRRAVADDRGV
jgi:FkbM family methyltransferase